MRIVQVVPSIAPEASGPSYSVSALCAALARQGHSVALHTTGPAGSVPRRVPGVRHRLHWQDGPLSRLGSSSSLRRSLYEESGNVDIVHSHSLWMMSNVYPYFAAQSLGVKVVVSPRGTMSQHALGISRIAKMAMWFSCQGPAVSFADCLHATSQEEVSDLRSIGFKNPIAMIPNGIDVGEKRQWANRGQRRTVVFLSRLHPIKGLDLLVEAWALLEAKYPLWDLLIVGPDGGALESTRHLSARLGVTRIVFQEPVFGAAKHKLLRSSDCFVLPSRSENFGMAVAEALAQGLPVVVCKGAPWQGVITNKCGYWVPNEVRDLRAALAAAMDLSDSDRLEMGERGRQWMLSEFSWDRLAFQMNEVYRWLLGKSTKPEFVTLAD